MFLLVLMVLGIKPQALHKADKSLTIGLYPQTSRLILNLLFIVPSYPDWVSIRSPG